MQIVYDVDYDLVGYKETGTFLLWIPETLFEIFVSEFRLDFHKKIEFLRIAELCTHRFERIINRKWCPEVYRISQQAIRTHLSQRFIQTTGTRSLRPEKYYIV